jgi:hypothetical protein
MPGHARDGLWTEFQTPPHVLDALFDFAYDPISKELVFVWCADDLEKDGTLSSGPVYAIRAKAPKHSNPPDPEF